VDELASGASGYWSRSAETLLAALGSSAKGLSSSEADRRLRQFGHNVLVLKKKSTLLGAFLGQFRNAIILILLFATGVSAVLHDWVD
jgi:Mg2+-importing ATPase